MASQSSLTRVAVAGATGYAGQELVRLLARHPAVQLTAAMASGTSSTPRRLPALARLWDGVVRPLAPDALAAEADIVFLALPDQAAAELAPSLVDAGVRVIDLSGAFRLREAAQRARWYPETHRMPEGVAYGLTERERDQVAGARLVANPGCYPTSALLALAPLLSAGLLVSGTDIIVDAKSGVSGAGKTPSERTHFSECHGSMAAYGVFNHRHGAEIEQGAGRRVTFTPHLAPLDRGILSTIYVRVAPGTTDETLADTYERAYAGQRFVRITGSALPEIKHVAHTNFCDIGWRVDPSGRVILVSVIDNLLKGASGQAVQNMNVMLGVDERTGLL
ncbi:MAG: N-acetyl-gamma-glutamyl-phosphate reductase [Acidobacteria bacterium RIFCSPLOWO2_12_FULL_65_11]|nr:MAG: N-acetyl-gamma-glutamyl-phosphate reductase [Acidobacteria bacterium RIFCSPLOWO2_02_FULL_64_15]OFW29135.1 MAG: N-acetyl-gamma-glutamyl-phosphate reductase [Acidobacteria bacterium RIFCSPLOWO2_12_FULL_65_11]